MSRMKVENCVALVTGGNRGIGEGFVQELLAHGASKVYVAARRMADAEAAASADDRLVPIELDVTSPEQVAAAAGQCTDLTLLVNNAGAFNLGNTLLTAEDEADIRQTMEVNYLGPVRMIRAFAPVLKANGGGAVVNVLSAGGIVPVPSMGGYSPSKFAMRAAGDCLRPELALQGTTLHSLIVGLHPPLDGFDVRRQRECLGVLVQRAAQTSQPAFDAVRAAFNPLWDGADAPIPSFDSLHRPGSPGTHPVEYPRRDLQ